MNIKEYIEWYNKQPEDTQMIYNYLIFVKIFSSKLLDKEIYNMLLKSEYIKKNNIKIEYEKINAGEEYYYEKIEKELLNRRHKIEIEFRAKKRTRYEILDI